MRAQKRHLQKERLILKPEKRKSAESIKHYTYLSGELKRRIKKDYDVYFNKVCAVVHLAQKRRKNKTLYDNIPTIFGSRAAIRTIKSANGKILSDPENVNSRWKDYFEALYNDSNPVDESVLSEIPSENRSERNTSGKI